METPFIKLRKILTAEFVDPADIEGIIGDANLPLEEIDQSGKTLTYWNSALKKAVELGKLEELIDFAIGYHDDCPALEEFKDSYQAAISSNEFFRYDVVEAKRALLNTLDRVGNGLPGVIDALRDNIYWTTINGKTRSDAGVEIYSLSADTGRDGVETLLKNKTRRVHPFLGTEPYSIHDADIFCEYHNQADYLTRRIIDGDKNQIVLTARRKGKTSFINAGVIPRLLIENRSYLIVNIRCYDNLFKRIKEAVNSLPISQTAPPEEKDPDRERPVVIVFDQFESFYEAMTSDAQHEFFEYLKAFIDSGVRIVVTCSGPSYIARARLEGIALLGEDDGFEPPHSDLLKCDKEKAGNIFRELLDRHSDSSFDSKLIPELVDDCADLEERGEDINLHLFQIICGHLFKTASLKKASINENLYKEEGRAGGIIFKYLNRVIDAGFEDRNERDLAWQIVASLRRGKTIEEIEPDLPPGNDPPAENFAERLEPILKRLSNLKLIDKRQQGDEIKYRSTFEIYADKAANLVESGSYEIFLVRQDFLNAWDKWKFSKILASKPQSKEFYNYRDNLKLNPVRLLFLVRSAIENNEPADYWLAALKKGDKGRKLIKELQKVDPSFAHKLNPAFDDFEYAIGLFANRNVSDSHPDQDGKTGEWLTETAVSDEDLKIRQTAALAVSLENPDVNLRERIDSLPDQNRWQKVKRRAELTGTLLNGLPRDDMETPKFPITDRFYSWFWRLSQRFEQSNISVSKFLIFSGLLGGIILGLSMAVVRNGTIDGDPAGYILIVVLGTIFGGFAVAIVAFSMVLAEFSRFRAYTNENEGYLQRITSDIYVIAASAISFGLINAFVNYSKWGEFRSTVSWIACGMLAGAGLGLGLKARSLFSESNRLLGYLTGSVVTATLFLLVQAIYYLIDPNLSLFFVIADNRNLSLSIADAGLVGLAFYLGISFGASKVRSPNHRYKFLLE